MRLFLEGLHLLNSGFPSVSNDHAPAQAGQPGQGLVEYALIIALIAVGVVLALTAFGNQLQTIFNTIVNGFSTAS
jgi:pilus assembly protein Flp/PilA